MIGSLFKKLSRDRKFRCGGYAVLLTVCVIGLVLLLNRLALLMEERYALTWDLSFNALTVQGETTKAVMRALEEDVHVYDVHTNTALSADMLTQDDLQLLLRRFQNLSPRFSWSEEDIVKNPDFSARFEDRLSGKPISANCLVVSCEKTGRVRVLDSGDYLTRSYDMETGAFAVSGYAIEKALTEAVLYVSKKTVPTVQILTGHGELTAADTAVLTAFLTANSYQTVRVTAGETLDPGSPLLIARPQFDLTEQELSSLLRFAGEGGSFLLLSGYQDPPELPRFSQLYLYFGFRLIPGLCVADENDTQSYYSGSTAVLAPYMQTVPQLSALTQSGRDFLLIPGARAFEILTERDTSIYAESLLKTGLSYIRQSADEDAEAPDPASGAYHDVAIYARRYADDGTSSRLAAVGSADLFCETWLMENTYSPEFLLALLQTLDGENALDLDIVQKTAVREPIRASSLALPAVLSLLLPLLVFILAVFILIPRRNL